MKKFTRGDKAEYMGQKHRVIGESHRGEYGHIYYKVKTEDQRKSVSVRSDHLELV